MDVAAVGSGDLHLHEPEGPDRRDLEDRRSRRCATSPAPGPVPGGGRQHVASPGDDPSLRDDVFGNLDANSPAERAQLDPSSCVIGTQLAGFNGSPGGATPTSAASRGASSGTPDDAAQGHRERSRSRTRPAARSTAPIRPTVTFRDVPPSIDVTKTADPTYVQDSGPVTTPS